MRHSVTPYGLYPAQFKLNGSEKHSEPGRSPPVTSDSLSSGHAKSEEQHRREICIAGRWMYERGHIVACEGNISVRLDDGSVLTTPTCMNKGMLAPQDLVITDMHGRQLAGDRKFPPNWRCISCSTACGQT